MNEGDNIKRFPIRPKKPDGVTLKIVQPYDKAGCQHGAEGNCYEVDLAGGTVHCGKCQANLDPLWVMLQLANQESHWHHNWSRYAEMVKEYRERRRTKCRHCGKMTDLR